MAVCSLGGVSGSTEDLRDVQVFRCCSPSPSCVLAAHWWSFALLQHLAPCLRQLGREEATCSERTGGKYDGHGLGDADEGLEDADAQDGGQFAEGVQEAERCGPEHNKCKLSQDYRNC